MADVEPGDVLAAINEAFGRHRGLDWYRWKHLDGPWGPSRGWVAVDNGEVVGTRLFVPWQLRSADGLHACSRAMDGATVPRARRRGIFSALIRREVDQLVDQPTWHCLYSTSVPASREAYRALGWTILPPTRMQYRPVRLRSAARVRLDASLPEPVAGSETRVRTNWNSAALAWRTDARSTVTYRTALLGDSAAASHGLVFRVLRRSGLRVLAPVHVWGPPTDRRRLVDGAALASRCLGVLEPVGPGTDGPSRPGRLSRGTSGSSVSLWAGGGGTGRPHDDVHRLSAWAFDQADLEGAL